jgi:hypothetical protein
MAEPGAITTAQLARLTGLTERHLRELAAKVGSQNRLTAVISSSQSFRVCCGITGSANSSGPCRTPTTAWGRARRPRESR